MEDIDAFGLVSIVAMVVAMGGLTLIEESGRRLVTFAYLMTVLVLGLGTAFGLLYLGVLPS